jgi:hypothetical protein
VSRVEFADCPECGSYDFVGAHRCEPAWWVHQVDEPESEVKVHARDPGEAAEKWAERDDWQSADYSIVGGRMSPDVVVAWGYGDGQFVAGVFRVTGRSEAVYSAAPVEVAP